jgi:flagellar motor switch protein FliG
VLDRLGETDPELADALRRSMFEFADIAALADADLRTLASHVTIAEWAMALKGSAEAFKQKIFNVLPRSDVQTLRGEMDRLSAVRLAHVDRVQRQIVDAARRLEVAGTIALPRQQSAA